MRKQSIILATMLLATLVVGVAVARAEDSVSATANTNTTVKPVAPVRKLNEVRQVVRDERQEIGDDRREAVTGIRADAKAEMKDGKTVEERKTILKESRLDAFKVRKDALVKQLNLSISNLTQISARISARIDKLAAEGKNMTEAKAALVTANAKIETAKTAIAALVAYTPTTSADASVTVQLEKPRQIGAAAIKAVKDARDSFRVVVKAIVKVVPATTPVRSVKAEDIRSVDASVNVNATVTQ